MRILKMKLNNVKNYCNMKKKLAIKGHPTRGKEVIELLEMMGGNIDKKILSAAHIGDVLNPNVYFFDPDSSDNRIVWYYLLGLEHDGRASEMMIFTLEEFLEKYPFKVGDKVFLYDNITEGCVTGMKWDADKGTIKYCVYTSAECWCDVKELLKWNLEDCERFNLRKTPVKNHKMGPKSKLPSKYYEDKLAEIQSKRDIDKEIFMIGPVMVPDKVDDKLEYDIIDGYEFDRIENNKIILKPIKPKYPTTYVECCKVMGINYRAQLSYTNPDVERGNIYLTKEKQLLNSFMRLRICRNAYWKIAGEEMELDKPWKPDWTNAEESKYCIVNKEGTIDKWIQKTIYKTLAFPTEEIRDAFYENFKDLIEACKKLLLI